MEELEISELERVACVYAALLFAHIRLLKRLLPGVMWREVPVTVVFEQNTYVNSLVTVKDELERALIQSGVKLAFYQKWSHNNNKHMLGKHVGAKVKLEMVLATVFAMASGRLCYCDTVMSVGWAVLTAAMNNDTDKNIHNTANAATLDISMYRRSHRGINLSTRGNNDVITLTPDNLTDTRHVQEGKLMLGKLRNELAMVTITKSPKSGGSHVSTGGKRSVNGQYTRDDVLSAMLLLCHTRDEIHTNNKTIKIQPEVYYD